MREVIRSVQASRKKANLLVDDRISLGLATTDKQLSRTISEHSGIIAAETLATKLDQTVYQTFATTVKIDGAELQISLQKAS
jgi:hypothetical protein